MGGMSLSDLIRFEPWPKIGRLNRTIVVTEKIDGTNAAVVIVDLAEAEQVVHAGLAGVDNPFFTAHANYAIAAQSRTRFIKPGKDTDNHGFAQWVYENRETLCQLGAGRHFGEWWGKGIQRGYGLDHKRFSLFNTARWGDSIPPKPRPECCHAVPVLYEGPHSGEAISAAFEKLREHGSFATPKGFGNPEGIVIYHTAIRQMFKQTFEHDAEGKGE